MIQIGALPATIDAPIEHLVACHRRIEQRLDTLVNVAAHLESDRVPALEAIAKSLHFLDTSGVLHTEDEESSLFPRLRPKLSVSEVAFIDSLESQHDEAEAMYAKLKQLASDLNQAIKPSHLVLGRYRDCAEQLRDLYRKHIRIEDELLTALVKRSLNKWDLMEISREMRKRRVPRVALKGSDRDSINLAHPRRTR